VRDAAAKAVQLAAAQIDADGAQLDRAYEPRSQSPTRLLAPYTSEWTSLTDPNELLRISMAICLRREAMLRQRSQSYSTSVMHSLAGASVKVCANTAVHPGGYLPLTGERTEGIDGPTTLVGTVTGYDPVAGEMTIDRQGIEYAIPMFAETQTLSDPCVQITRIESLVLPER